MSDLLEGCHSHGLSLSAVEAWWQAAEESQAVVSFCLCCKGPAPDGDDLCKHCVRVTPARWKEITGL